VSASFHADKSAVSRQAHSTLPPSLPPYVPQKQLNKNDRLTKLLASKLEERKEAAAARRAAARRMARKDPSRPPVRECSRRASKEGGGLGWEETSDLYVLVNGLDGRSSSPELLSLLLRLVRQTGARVVASVDHVDAPLVFDAEHLAGFEWVWQHAPTFAPYDHRADARGLGALEEQGAPQAEAAQAKDQVKTLMQTLPPRHRDLLRILAQHQLASKAKAGQSDGMTFRELFQRCVRACVLG
jgi:hypothetical protein